MRNAISCVDILVSVILPAVEAKRFFLCLMQGFTLGIYSLLTSLTKKVDKYIAVSEHVRQEYIKHGYNKDRIIVIPNSIDIDKFGDGVRRSHEYRNILYVGRMASRKGVNMLIRAFHKACSHYHD